MNKFIYMLTLAMLLGTAGGFEASAQQINLNPLTIAQPKGASADPGSLGTLLDPPGMPPSPTLPLPTLQQYPVSLCYTNYYIALDGLKNSLPYYDPVERERIINMQRVMLYNTLQNCTNTPIFPLKN